MQLVPIISQFKLEGTIVDVTPISSGHINDTFRLVNQSPDLPDYLLQRINHHVFPPVIEMMRNIRKVTEHINAKEPGFTLNLISSKNRQDFVKDSSGNYWRMFIYRKALLSYDVVENNEQIYEGAKAFGKFLFQLADFPTNELYPVIPDFHNIITRLDTFQSAVEKDVKKRRKEAQPIVDYVFEIAEIMCRIERAKIAGTLPIRVTHNDTKFNNVLLDKTGKGRCVIDLDTVMPGIVHYDFGDGIRTTVSAAAEDEKDLEEIQVELDRFKAFAEGYLEMTRDILRPVELQFLPLSGPLLAYLMGVRFLTDFLQGDVYYKTHFEGHNLQRARAQLELTRKLLERQEDLAKLI